MTGTANAIGGAVAGAAFTLVAFVSASALKSPANDPITAFDASRPFAGPAYVSAVAPAPAVVQPRVVQPREVQPRVVPQTAETVVVREAPRDESSSHHRSWQKTAMVIGGSTAAGAGVGGLVGGKKGALVGAAIGGGASTIYESVKR